MTQESLADKGVKSVKSGQTPVKLEDMIVRLEEYVNKFTERISDIMRADNGNIYTPDLYILPLLNRAVNLTSGFIILSKEKNYLCAVPLIRLQLDNSLRFHATNLVDNPDDLVQFWLKGGYIGNLLDRKGKKMNDTYLSGQLDKIFPGVKKLYKNTSGYVHLSDMHFYATIQQSGPGEGRMHFGNGPDLFTDEQEINFAHQMAESCKLVLIMTEGYKDQKQAKGKST